MQLVELKTMENDCVTLFVLYRNGAEGVHAELDVGCIYMRVSVLSVSRENKALEMSSVS